MSCKTLLALGVMLGGAGASPAANLLVNGGFEAAPPPAIGFRNTAAAPAGEVQDYFGNRITNEQFVTDWTIATPSVANLIRAPYAYALGPGVAAEGAQFMSINWSPLGGVVLDNTISQAFTLGAGSTGVNFSTFMTTEAGYNQSTLQVSILDALGGVVAQSGLLTNPAGQTWSQKTWTAALAPGSYTLTLRGIGSGNAWDVLVDDVQLQAIGGGAAGVPEPATWATMMIGFGAIGATLRRRRRAAAIA